jgi:hypothetical protein
MDTDGIVPPVEKSESHSRTYKLLHGRNNDSFTQSLVERVTELQKAWSDEMAFGTSYIKVDLDGNVRHIELGSEEGRAIHKKMVEHSKQQNK